MAFEGFRGIFHLDKGSDDEYEEDYEEFDEFDDFDDEDDFEPNPPKKKKAVLKTEKYAQEDNYDDFAEPVKEPEKKKKSTDFFGSRKQESRVINMSKNSNYGNSNGQIFMLKPKKIDDAKAAVDALLSNKIVILNLEGIALDLAQSVTDFISGASYCISGNFSTISQNVFVYTPSGFDLTGAFDEEFLGSSLRDY